MTLHNATGLSDQYVILKNAIICPPDPESGACGVLDSEGRFVEFSREFPRPRKPAPPPDPAILNGPLEHMPGCHLYAGWLRPHFGHMLVEATARLWAMDEMAADVQSVLFIPSGPNTIWRARRQYRDLLELFTMGREPMPITVPMRIERLIVPDAGFGHEARMTGSPRYRAYMRGRVMADIKPKGGKKLYISRTQIRETKGRVFAESRIEAMLAAEGYEIYHPQLHSQLDQLARYRAARHVVGLDGSAFHLAAFALAPETKIGLIARRTTALQDYLTDHLQQFTGAEIHSINVLRDVWVNKGQTRVDYSAIGELDFPALAAALRKSGFLKKLPKVENLSAGDLALAISQSGRGDMERFSDAAP